MKPRNSLSSAVFWTVVSAVLFFLVFRYRSTLPVGALAFEDGHFWRIALVGVAFVGVMAVGSVAVAKWLKIARGSRKKRMREFRRRTRADEPGYPDRDMLDKKL